MHLQIFTAANQIPSHSLGVICMGAKQNLTCPLQQYPISLTNSIKSMSTIKSPVQLIWYITIVVRSLVERQTAVVTS